MNEQDKSYRLLLPVVLDQNIVVSVRNTVTKVMRITY